MTKRSMMNSADTDGITLSAITRDRMIIILGIVLVMLLFFINLNSLDLFSINQNDYYLRALNEREWLQNDWFAHTRTNMPVFTELVRAMEHLNILEIGTDILEISLYLLLCLSVWWLIDGLYKHMIANGWDSLTNVNRQYLTLFTFGMFLLAVRLPTLLAAPLPGPLQTLWNATWNLEGLANQSIFAGYLQPSEFGILILVALAMLLQKRWRIATLLLAIFVNIHVGYLIHCGLLVVTYSTWLYTQGERRKAIESVLIFGIASIPIFIYAPLAIMIEPGSAQTKYLIAYERIPHHTLPWEFWTPLQAQRVGFMIMATAFAVWKLPGLIRWILVTHVTVTCAALLFVTVTGNETIALMHVWRNSTYIYPLSMIILTNFVFGSIIFLIRQRNPQLLRFAIIGFYGLLIISLGFEGIFGISNNIASAKEPNQYLEIAQAVHDNTRPDDLIIIPSNSIRWDDFRLDAERSIYVDWKSHPYFPIDFMEWWDRVQTIIAFYEADLEYRLNFCADNGVSYYVAEITEDHPEQLVIASTEQYQLVQCQAGN